MGPVLSIVMPFNDASDINLALRCLTAIDLHEMRKHRLPSMYSPLAGLQYRREVCLAPSVRETCERFLSYRMMLLEKYVDCDDASAARAAELIKAGDLRARAFAEPSNVGWHCKTRHGNGLIEDPSVVLGMGRER